jgi:hypothetical protein
VNHAAKRLALAFISASAFLYLCAHAARGQKAEPSADAPRGSLSEVGRMRRALTLVGRVTIMDASDPERAVVERALKGDPRENRRYRPAYNEIASVLNRYIRKYKSLTPAESVDEADFVIFFDLLEYRRILYDRYPFGVLYVIVKGAPDGATRPHVVWRSRKVETADDATRELIKGLKPLRGEI